MDDAVLTSRWVSSQHYQTTKVVQRENGSTSFASCGGSTLNETMHVPTTTLGSEVVLALLSQCGSLISRDASVAFMNADCARAGVVQMPWNVSLKDEMSLFG